jgi:succinate dehydrogenase/fumarate reductase flavoprotein subunit
MQTTAADDVRDTTVDVVVVGSGTGMAAALQAHQLGLSVLVIEKTGYVGGSMALSGGGLWAPGNSVLADARTGDSIESGKEYARDLVGSTSPARRWRAAIDNGPAAIDLLRNRTGLKLFWSKGYSDYHPERRGGTAIGRTVEAKPFNARVLKHAPAPLRSSNLKAPVPMPVTSADYRRMNLVGKVPTSGVPTIARRAVQGIAGKAIGRDYVAGGQALAAGLYAGLLRAGIEIWTQTELTQLLTSDDRVTGAVVEHDGGEVAITARKGVILATGGFDHNPEWRRKYQSEVIEPGWSLGSSDNVGDGIRIATEIGADTVSMDQTWWFPALAPVGDEPPTVLLAERSLPGSLIIDQHGHRFGNEATDSMSFGQNVIARERAGDPITSMWIIFDSEYRNSYMFGAGVFPRQPLPKAWYEAGIAHRARGPVELAAQLGVPAENLGATLDRYNALAQAGVDHDYGRGTSAYNQYYGDPTVHPNPNLRPLHGDTLYAVRVVLGDLGTCGGIRANGTGQALRADDSVIDGLYAIGNTAGNTYGEYCPGAGAPIAQGMALGIAAANDAAAKAGASSSGSR